MTTSSINTSSIPGPIVLSSWLSANADKLQPPVNNLCLYSGKDFTLMAVGGPNTRIDYHTNLMDAQVNETEEWFYQIKGDMLLKIIENGNFRDVHIREGETFLVPGNTPHSPIRSRDTVGLVMERTRPPGSIDRLRWYCPNKETHGEQPVMIREEAFHCEDIETQLKVVIKEWMENESSRRCNTCGMTAPSY